MVKKLIGIRFDEEELGVIDRLAEGNGSNRQDIVRDLVRKAGNITTMEYPSDSRNRRLYETFISLSTEDDPKVSVDQSKKIMNLASISSGKTFKRRVEMLRDQGFLGWRSECFVVLRKWSR